MDPSPPPDVAPFVSSRPVPKKAVLIVNAHSRRGRVLFREAVEKLRAAGIDLIASYAIRDPAKLVPKVREAVREGAPMVIVGGGDGSLSCAVDEMVDRDCVFALLPLGTANSFARTLSIPLDLDGAIAVIANGRRRRVDLGMIEGDYFANSAAMGLSPMIAEGVPHKLKRYLGRVGYLIWAIWCLIRFHPFRLTVDDGSGPRTIWAMEVRIANGGFHGGVEVVEAANVDSGEIVIQAVTGRSNLLLIWDWISKYFKLPARHATTEEFHGRLFTLEARPRQRISIDGEVSARTPVVVQIAERAIEVVVPSPTG